MIALDVEQNSPEWYAARVGIPTASCFDKLITNKGEPSKQRVKYIRQLAAERITGKHENGFESKSMMRGKEFEEEARNLYALTTSQKIVPVGVCYPNKNKEYAASPDALVGKNGLLEIKCPLSWTHVGYLLNGKLPEEYFQQCQGQLFVTGRSWVDFESYYPGLKPLIVRVRRDEKFIAALSAELKKAVREITTISNKIK